LRATIKPVVNLGPTVHKWLLLVAAGLVIAGLGALAGRHVSLREVPTKKEAFKAFSRVQDDIGSLYRVLTPEAPPLVEDPADQHQVPENPDAPFTRADLHSKSAAVRQEVLSWIRRELRARYDSAPAPANQQRVRYVFTAPGETAEWVSGPGESCRSVSVENLGTALAEDVTIVLDGQRPATTVREMAESMLGSAATEKDKAFALWRGVVDGRRHDWPAHPESSDPVKLLGVYGYGFCLNSAEALAALARSAGLSARVMHARGSHVVTEVMIDGRWALFDPDAGTAYPKPDGSMASLEDLQRDPGLLSTAPSDVYSAEHLRRIYSSEVFTERTTRQPQTLHALRMDLRPGESIVYSQDKKGLFFATRYLEEPREYANGLWQFRPRFSDESWRAGFASAENLTAVQDAGGAWFLTAADPKKPWQLTSEFSLPYPALDGGVEIDFAGEGLSVELSRDGSTWQEIRGLPAVDGVQDFPLAGWLRSVEGAPDYRFWVRLASSPSSAAWRIARLVYRYDLQMAPRRLPLPTTATRTVAVDYVSSKPTQIGVEAVLSESSGVGPSAP